MVGGRKEATQEECHDIKTTGERSFREFLLICHAGLDPVSRGLI